MQISEHIKGKFDIIRGFFKKLEAADCLKIKDTKLQIIVFSGIFAGFFLFYIYYAFSAWFLMDDFVFMKLYSGGLHPGDIYNLTENFGRFITRNLYWFIFFKIFGKNPIGYFLTNLAVIIINSFLVYNIVRVYLSDKLISISVAAVYFAGFPTISNYVWISNSQHLVAHTFIFGFIYLLITRDVFSGNNLKDKSILFILYLLGLYSNVYTIFVLPIMIVYLFINRDKFKNSIINYSFIIMLFILAGYFALTIMKMATGPYESRISLDVFFKTIRFYMAGLSLLPNKLTLILILFILIAGARRVFLTDDKKIIFILAASISFYLPFAFAVHHKYINYMALSFVFIVLALFYLLQNYKKIILILTVVFVLQDYADVLIYYRNPFGGYVRVFIEEFNRIDIKGYKTVVLKPDERSFKILWGFPHFWWILGFGSALTMFSDQGKDYQLYDKSKFYDNAVIFQIDRGMRIRRVMPEGKK